MNNDGQPVDDLIQNMIVDNSMFEEAEPMDTVLIKKQVLSRDSLKWFILVCAILYLYYYLDGKYDDLVDLNPLFQDDS